MTREQEAAVQRLRGIAARRDWRTITVTVTDLRMLLAVFDEAEARVPPLWRENRVVAEKRP